MTPTGRRYAGRDNRTGRAPWRPTYREMRDEDGGDLWLVHEKGSGGKGPWRLRVEEMTGPGNGKPGERGMFVLIEEHG